MTLKRFMKNFLHYSYRKPKTRKFGAMTIRELNMKHIYLKKISHIFEANQEIIFLDEATLSYKNKFKKSWFYKFSEFDRTQNNSFKSVKLLVAANQRGILFYNIIDENWNSVNFTKILKENTKVLQKSNLGNLK